MVIDSHMHFEPRLLPEADLLNRMDECKIDKAVLVAALTEPPEMDKPAWMMAVQRHLFYHSLLRPIAIRITEGMYQEEGTWNMKGIRWLLKSKPHRFSIISKPDNESVFKMIRRYPKRFLGWAFINPKLPESIDELRKICADPDMIGVKLHPFWHRYSLRDIDPLLELTSERGIPINIHLGFGKSGDYVYLLEHFPKQKFIFSHLAVPYYKDCWRKIRDLENCSVDVSSLHHVDRFLFNRALHFLGPRKIIFASDLPYTPRETPLIIQSWIDKAGIPPEDRELIYSKNFERLIH